MASSIDWTALNSIKSCNSALDISVGTVVLIGDGGGGGWHGHEGMT